MNYTMPFLWIADNNYDYISRQIEKIKESGSSTFCVESRTHEDFCGEKWWEVMDFIIEKASSLNMNVWVFDDKHYPTGCANGVLWKNPDLQQKQLFSENTDVLGPIENAKLVLKRGNVDKYKGEIYSIALLKRENEDSFSFFSDITDSIMQGGDFLKISIPEGYFRICVMYVGTGIEIADYRSVDMLNKDSVGLLIEEVYEPHYKRYKNTCFKGFFSDEPRFGNDIYDRGISTMSFYGGKVGVMGLSYPWRETVNEYLKSKVPNYEKAYLSALWNNISEITSELRVNYMDYITRCYAENFSGQLSNWCHDRNLKYASHIIEDLGAHTATFNSAGHYFRSQTGADFAGIDVVLRQIQPHYTDYSYISPVGYISPLFFNNTLAKLASSCAHLDKIKQNRALCEIFGAYGWGETSSEMLYLVNHMFVRGVNYFIPHAFSSKYPNADCPPYFDYNEENYSFYAYKKINEYINYLSNFFEGTMDEIKVAVLYHAEAEWSGQDFSPIDSICKSLFENQIDFDIITEDHLKEIDLKQGLVINNRKYDYLIIPYRKYFSVELLNILKQLEDKIKIFKQKEKNILDIKDLIPEEVKTINLCEFKKDIRVRRIIKDQRIYFFVHNEKNESDILNIRNITYKSIKVIDKLNEDVYYIQCNGGIASLEIRAGQALILELSDEEGPTINKFNHKLNFGLESIHLIDAFNNDRERIENANIRDVFLSKPDFSGIAEIKGVMDTTGYNSIKINFTGNYLEVLIGEHKFERVTSPAIINLSKNCNKEKIVFTICNTLADKYKDKFSKYSLIEPVGILDILGAKK